VNRDRRGRLRRAGSNANPVLEMSRSTASMTVATSATAIPEIPKVLPVLAVSWGDSPASASTELQAATM